ncbi:MAG: DUF3570 domain-containing protein [Myxococcales bacterium]|jgi:hypothetical protein
MCRTRPKRPPRLERTLLFLLALLAAIVASTVPARADDVTGTWTGQLEAHGNYYLERSTRVIMPEARIELESPIGVDVNAGYLVDVIASASIAQTGSDEDAVFHEARQQFMGGLGYEVDVGAPLELTGGMIYSTETDYESYIGQLGATLGLNQRATVLGLSAALASDTVQSNADPTFEEGKRSLTLNSTFEQILSRTLTLTLGYTFAYQEGFLANPYRRVLLGPLPYAEKHPPERFRHAAFARLGAFIPATDTAVHLIYRGYMDSWHIGAVNPELRVVQELHPAFLVGTHYRFYTQTRASFQKDAYPAGYEGFITNDPKMTAHTTHVFGGRIDWRLAFLDDTALDLFSKGWIILTFDRYLNTNAFGDGFIATVGGRLPF